MSDWCCFCGRGASFDARIKSDNALIQDLARALEGARSWVECGSPLSPSYPVGYMGAVVERKRVLQAIDAVLSRAKEGVQG